MRRGDAAIGVSCSSAALVARRRRAGPLRASFGLALVALALGCGQAARDRPRHVVLISIDTLSRSSLAPFDASAPELPHLDSFAGEAAVFLDALSTASWTLPAHASLLTGLYPDRHGATQRNLQIARRIETLAHALAAAGYETLAFTDGGFVDRSFGFGRGFARYDAWSPQPSAAPALELPRGGKPHADPGRALFDRAISFVAQRRASDPPFFLFLQTYAVHNYYRRHPWAIAASRGSLDPASLRAPSEYLRCMLGRTRCPDDWPVLSALYRGELANLDAGFGKLMDAIDAAGLAPSTLVVFLSDHGEGFDFAHRRIHHGGRLHEDVIRIPLMMRGPTVVARRISAPISLVDVMPTVLDLLGLAVPPGLDGVSLAAVARGGAAGGAAPRYAMEFSQWWDEGGLHNAEEIRSSPLQLSVMRPELWYIRHADSRDELYDMREDPRQRRDLGASAPDARLRALADERWTRRPPQEPLRAGDEVHDRLRALGYAD